MKQKYFSLVFIFFVNLLSFAQTTILTNHPSNNDNGSVIFNVQNTNSYPIKITGVSCHLGTTANNNIELLYNTVPFSDSSAPWSGGTVGANQNGWVLAGTNSVENSNTANGIVSVLSNLNLIIPAGATYQLGLSSTTMQYSTLTEGAGVNTFSANGVNLLTGDGIGWGGTAYPSTPANYPRGLIGGITFEPDAASHLNFDGTNDFVTVPHNSSLAFGTNNLTLEAMVKMSAAQGSYSGIITKATSSTFGGIQFVVVNNRIALEFGNGTMLGVGNGLIGTTTLNDNNWHHVACVVDRANSNIKLYVDGIVEANVTNAFIGTANITTTTPLFIGKERNSIDYLESSIDEVRIWNIARSAGDISRSKNCELQGNETGLIAYYKFNQGFASANNATVITLTDATSNANNGTLSGFALVGATSNWLAGSSVTTGSIIPSVPAVSTPVVYNQDATATALTATVGANGTGLLWYTVASGGTGTATAPTPDTSTASSTSYWVSSTNANGCESERTELVVQVNANATHLNFDGTNDHVAVPPTAINNLPQGTIEAWIYPTATILDNQTICAKQSDFENSYAVFSLGGGNAANGKLFYKSKNAGTIVSNSTLTANQWTHVAVSFTNTQAKIYINGTLDATASGDFSLPDDVTVTATTLGAWLGDAGGQYFQGNIDEFRVWNVALNASDILNTMNCELQSGETNIMTYYKFNQGFDAASNTAVTVLNDGVGSNNGTLTNFALTGATSNWKSGFTVATGNTCTVLSLEAFSALTLQVYPNPSRGIFTISTKEDVTVALYDLVGKQIKTQQLNSGDATVDISGYPSGIYLLQITNAQGDSRQYKLIKQ